MFWPLTEPKFKFAGSEKHPWFLEKFLRSKRPVSSLIQCDTGSCCWWHLLLPLANPPLLGVVGVWVEVAVFLSLIGVFISKNKTFLSSGFTKFPASWLNEITADAWVTVANRVQRIKKNTQQGAAFTQDLHDCFHWLMKLRSATSKALSKTHTHTAGLRLPPCHETAVARGLSGDFEDLTTLRPFVLWLLFTDHELVCITPFGRWQKTRRGERRRMVNKDYADLNPGILPTWRRTSS